MKRAPAFALSLALGCTACGSGIDVTRVSDSSTPQTGVPWNLAMTQFRLTITRQVTGCDGTLKGAVLVAATAGKAPDPAQKYLLDANGVWATSDIASSLAADGTSTGLNAQSQDMTAQVITNIVSLAAEIGVAAAGAGPLMARAATISPAYTCSKQVSDALKDMHPANKPSLKKQVNAETMALANATGRLTLLTAQASKDRTYDRMLAKAIGEQSAAQTTLTKDQTRLANDMKVVTDVQTVVWPQQADQFATGAPYKLPGATLAKWITLGPARIGATAPSISDVDTSVFDVSLTLYRAANDGGWVPPAKPAVGDVTVGVPVRVAHMGRLLICTGGAARPQSLPVGWESTQPKNQVAIDQPVLQLGQMYNVRVRGGVFKSEGAVIALDPSGEPTSIEVTEKAAAAASATGAASSGATTLAGIPSAIATLQTAQAQALSAKITAQNALIAYQASSPTALATGLANAQTGLINAQTGLATAQANAPTVVPTAVTQAQTALYNAQTALATAAANAGNAGPAAAVAVQISQLQAQNTLAGLEAGAPDAPQVDALTTQTTLLTAEASQINAQVALTAAQAQLP